MDNNIIHNKNKQQFEMHLQDGLIAFVTYTQKGDHLSLTYSEVPAKFRGQGIGKQLVLNTFEAIKAEGLTATAYCSYVKAIAKQTEDYKNIIHY